MLRTPYFSHVDVVVFNKVLYSNIVYTSTEDTPMYIQSENNHLTKHGLESQGRLMSTLIGILKLFEKENVNIFFEQLTLQDEHHNLT